jgi:hypothetical protein
MGLPTLVRTATIVMPQTNILKATVEAWARAQATSMAATFNGVPRPWKRQTEVTLQLGAGPWSRVRRGAEMLRRSYAVEI